MKKILCLLAAAFAAVAGQAAITWNWVTVPTDPAIAAQITSAMDTAVARYNTYSTYSSNIPVEYVAGVPTAQASWGWRIQFGGSRNARVAQHEMAHFLACGGHSGWTDHVVGGVWNGVNATAKIQAYDSATATVGCDAQHFWPYGWNYDSEGVNPERNVGLVGGLRKDMGLNDLTIGIAPGTYRLQNRATGKLLDNYGGASDGATVRQQASSTSNNQKWIVTLVAGGYSKLQAVSGSRYLDTLGNTTDGSSIGVWTGGGSNNQQWTITQTDSGYYKLVNRGNGKCLDTGGQTTDGSVMQNWGSGSSYNQQWKFVR